MGTARSPLGSAPAARRLPPRSRPRRALAALVPLGALALLLGACSEAHHYEVDLDGSYQRVDEDGKPLPGQTAYHAGEAMAGGAAMDDATHATAGDPGAPGGGTLRGTITLQSDLGVNPADFNCVFIMVRRDASKGTDFVRKIEHPRFPQEFEVSAGGHDGPAAALSGAYQIIARLDSDGEATAQLGDVQGMAIEAALPGGPPVTVVLNQLLTGDGQAPRPAPLSAAGGGAAGLDLPVTGATGAAGAADTAGTAVDAGPRLEGTVELDPAFASLAGQGRLFVSVKSPQAAGGMPIAVTAIDAPRFPQAFRLTTANIPLDVDNKAELLSGDLKITARLSLSGTAIGQPGDIESEPQIVRADGEKLTLRLTRRRDG